MKKANTLITVILLALTSLTAVAQESAQKLYRIHVKDFSRIRSIERTGITIYNQKPGAYIEVLALPEQIQNLTIEGATIEFVGNSFKEIYEKVPQLKNIPPFHNYQTTINELVDIAARYPHITHLDTIGYSVLGRAICCLKISDNPLLDEDEKPLLFIGNHHGNEVHSVEATLYQIQYLVENYATDPEVANWVNTMEIWYVPMMNPDGREALQRANNHGVDLNRNYSFGFTPGGSHGPEAFSEPETRAIRDLAAKYPPIMSMTYHTSGQYVLYSWTHTDDAAPDSSAMIYLGSIIGESIATTNGHYTLMQGGRWYFTEGEYCDYMYATHNTLAFTIEMGTSQAPDYTVMPAMSAANLEGLKTMLRQTDKAGISGLVTDSGSGQPLVATIDIPAIDKQGKVPVRLTDSLYGRYYRYLEPGTYTFEITAPGYRTIEQEVTIYPEIMQTWDIEMQRTAFLEVSPVIISDEPSGNTSGNGDGKINVGETIGLGFTLKNLRLIPAPSVYAKITTTNSRVTLLSDSLWFGNIGANETGESVDRALFRVDPSIHDGEQLEFIITIGDDGGTGWSEKIELEVFAPKVELARVNINDEGGNQNGAFDKGETVIVEVQITNNGRQAIHELSALISTNDPYYHTVTQQDEADQLGIGETLTFQFSVLQDSDTPEAYFGDFGLTLTSLEGHAPMFVFSLNNIHGFFDDFESGENGWSHHPYGTTSNPHDDWQLGTPAGKGGDPSQAFSGSACWGTDMGWDSYQGSSWDGLYQNFVHNYLRSKEIDCSGMVDVGLKFKRWLNVRVSDFARILVNNQVVWESPRLGIQEEDWTDQLIDISAVADGNPSVTITFELETNSSATAGGWNIDDVMVGNRLAGWISSVEIPETGDHAALYDASPNPATTHTRIRYYLPGEERVELGIYDLNGKLMKSLVAEGQAPGMQEVIWDGTNDMGLPVTPGIYLYRMRTGKVVIAKRLVIIPPGVQ